MATQPGRMLDKSGYLSQDTITALACPTGGAITVLRISGEKAMVGLAALTQTTGRLWGEREPRVLYRARVYVQEAGAAGSVTRGIDDALVCFFKKPASFTGEDLVELYLHGGSFGASLVLEQLFSLGIRQALPGEFSFRAVRNGKMDVSQAQAIADLIEASNSTALEMAVEKLDGAQSRFLSAFAENLRRLVTLSEVGIDFSDQDVEEVALPRLKEQVEGVYRQLRELEESFAKGARIQEGIRVALVGLPNAGKSSFFNALLGEDRSIVSEIAGTTRDVVRERLTLRGRLGSVTLRLEDTAGIRKTEDPIEKIGVERALDSARRSDLVLWVIESQADWPSVDSLRERLLLYQEKTVIILSKSDLFQEGEPPVGERLSKEGWSRIFPCSIHQAGTIEAAAEGIASFCEKWLRRGEGEILLTRHEQVQAAREAVAHLDRALVAQDAALFAADLRHALNSLGPLMGETPTDEILGRIFSNFCIGK